MDAVSAERAIKAAREDFAHLPEERREQLESRFQEASEQAHVHSDYTRR